MIITPKVTLTRTLTVV